MVVECHGVELTELNVFAFSYLQNVAVLAIYFYKYDLDTVIHHISSPGMSALNTIERVMKFIGEWFNGAVVDIFQVSIFCLHTIESILIAAALYSLPA